MVQTNQSKGIWEQPGIFLNVFKWYYGLTANLVRCDTDGLVREEVFFFFHDAY